MDFHGLHALARSFVEEAGIFVRGIDFSTAAVTLKRRFVVHFGVTPCLCAWIWLIAEEQFNDNEVRHIHLLWVLNVLKTDDTEAVMKGRWGCDEKTFRKWLYVVLDVVSSLGLIEWKNRYATQSNCRVYITVDGTDFKIKEPSPFSTSWYSQKHNGPGLRYEVGICIETGWIVWFNGPFKPGEYSDLKLAQEGGLHDILDENERYIADGTYKCDEAIGPDNVSNHYETLYMRLARSRHETVNGLIKTFRLARNRFERSPYKHGLFMHSIAQIVQLGLMTGEMEASLDLSGVLQPPSWPATWEFR